MTSDEAQTEALKRWGLNGYARRVLGNYQVGNYYGVEFGIGDTWEEAFAAADRREAASLDKERTRMSKRKPNSEIAERIAMALFTNGQGQVADRLVLLLPGCLYGGGWCFQAVVDQIQNALMATSLEGK